MDNVNAWEALGLEPPQEEQLEQGPEGEKEQEAAEPASEGEREQETAEPAAEDPQEEDEPAEEPRPQTREERAEYARRRRQQEIDDAVNAALEKERAETRKREEAFFAAARIQNPHNGNAEIKTLEEAEAWAQADKQARLQENLRNGRLTTEDLQNAIDGSPTMQAMKQQLDAARQQTAEADREKFEQTVQGELEQIQKLDPTMKTLADIVQGENGKAFARYVEKGLTYLEAFKLANSDRLQEQARNLGRVAGQINTGGKEHLRRTPGRGEAAKTVPSQVKANYRALFGDDISDEEIQKDYQRYHR